MMKICLLTPYISIVVGIFSLLGNTSAMSIGVNANGSEHGLGLAIDTPFETSQSGMPTTINAWLENNNLGGSNNHDPDLPDQVPDDPPNDVPSNIPDIPDNNDGMGTLLRELLDINEPEADELRNVIESWQEEHEIGPFNTSANNAALGLTTSSITITATSSLPVVSAVPVPAAVWLFGSGLIGLISIAKRKKNT
jgi:hypothetical protein